jgi:hypothetical protein
MVFYVVTPTDGRKSRKTLKNEFVTLKQFFMKKIILKQENPKELWHRGRFNYFAERLLSFLYGHEEHVPKEYRIDEIEFLSVGRFPNKSIHIIPEDNDLKAGDHVQFQVKPKTKAINVTPEMEVVAVESLKVEKKKLQNQNCFQLLLEQEGHPIGQIRYTAGRVTHMDREVEKLMELHGVPVKEVFYSEIANGGNFSVLYFETNQKPEKREEE